MKRFLHVRGKPGVPVSNPHTPNDPFRFVGQRRHNKAMPPDAELMEYFEPVDEVIVDHPDLAKPIRKGALELLGKVGHKSLELAREHFAKKPEASSKAPRGGRTE